MNKKGLIIVITVLFVVVFAGYKFIFSRSRDLGGLKAAANLPANVFLNDKLIGNTPFEDKHVTGEFIIKLIPQDTTDQSVSWQGKVKINPSVLTYVNRELGQSELTSGGEVLTLERTNQEQPQLEVSSQPDAATILVDGQEKGVASQVIAISEGEHDVAVASPGFIGRTIRVQATKGYKLKVDFQLVLSQSEAELIPSTQSGQPTPTGVKTTQPGKTSIQIKDTPTGFLRVRNAPNTSATEVAQVKPKDTYPLLEEKEGWYKILYAEGKEGWVSGRYAQKAD